MVGKVDLISKRLKTKELLLEDSRAIGRNGAINLKRLLLDAGGEISDKTNLYAPDDVFIRGFSQKTGDNPPVQILLSFRDADLLVRTLFSLITDLKEKCRKEE